MVGEKKMAVAMTKTYFFYFPSFFYFKAWSFRRAKINMP